VRIYDDAKLSIWAELKQEFIDSVPGRVPLKTESADRTDYILHPTTGERLNESSIATLLRLRRQQAGRFDIQIVISDGLNALAIMEEGHLRPFLSRLRRGLIDRQMSVSPQNLVVTSGRVRAGYRIGETIFDGLERQRAIVHLIGERPGTGHRTFSTYITAAKGDAWGKAGTIDHNITKVVSGIATTAMSPPAGADEVVRLLAGMLDQPS
jgi:ethanolamine ammonia-lyase large subunit